MNQHQQLANVQHLEKMRDLAHRADHVARMAQDQPDVSLRAAAAGAKAQAEALLKAAEDAHYGAEMENLISHWDTDQHGRPVKNPLRKAG